VVAVVAQPHGDMISHEDDERIRTTIALLGGPPQSAMGAACATETLSLPLAIAQRQDESPLDRCWELDPAWPSSAGV